MQSNPDFNDIGVRSFILSGAPPLGTLPGRLTGPARSRMIIVIGVVVAAQGNIQCPGRLYRSFHPSLQQAN